MAHILAKSSLSRAAHGVVSLAAISLSASAFAQEHIASTPVGEDKLVEITQPDVKVRSKTYPTITFLRGDSITVTAGGCVQTGGSRKTWKRYVNPSGGDSDRLYHGLIQIPGATAGLVRLISVVGRPVTIPQSFSPPSGQVIQLTLGYEDDGYGDNGYWGHDDGTENQCAGPGGGPAWVKLMIHHGPLSAVVAPFDLTWKAADANGLPLNPRWGKQDDPHQPGLPGQALCPRPWEAPCTTQSPTIVDLPFPLEPLHPYNALCKVSGPLGKHVNWGIATYEGAAVWDSHSSFSSDQFQADDDYNINVLRLDQSAYTQENPNFLHTEFDSDETIHDFHSAWWSQFKDAVNGGSGTVIDKKEIIEIGVVGLDCAHSCGSEIHPVLALAIHVKDDPNDDEWAIFARNTGDEGFCSHDSVLAPELSTLYLTLPFREGATGVTVKNTTDFQKTSDQIQIKTFPLMAGNAPSGFIVQVDLGDPTRAPMINGELYLQWTMATGAIAASDRGGPLLSAEISTFSGSTTSATTPSAPEPEERLEKMVAGLPASTQQQLKTLKRVSPHLNWTPLSPINLTAPPSDFQARISARASTNGKRGVLGKMVVVPNQGKLDYYKKVGDILRQQALPH